MKLLFLTRRGEGYVGAPQTYYEFEQTVDKYAECKYAGIGYKLHKPDESMDDTVTRVMPDADWVIAEKNNTWSLPKNRDYKVAVCISDLHGKVNMDIHTPRDFLELINDTGFDAVFLRYLEVYDCNCNPDLFTKELNTDWFHLPWSVDVCKHTWKRKTVDAGFIGAHHEQYYPLRHDIYQHLPRLCKEHNHYTLTAPKGATYKRRVSELNGYVGEKYAELLNKTRILLFGSSKYKYPVQKYFEASASACLILADKPSGWRQLGFNEETMIPVTLDDWRDKLMYSLEHYEDEGKHVARQGLKNTLLNHSHETRAKEFIEMLGQ